MSPVVLLILDGFGVAPAAHGNAIAAADIPNLDRLVQENFATTLQAAGEAVGLPYGNIGNSEVGHVNLGAGRIVYQHVPRIASALGSGDFFENPAFLRVMAHVKGTGGTLHLIGMLSDAGVHSQLEHLLALIELAAKQNVKDVVIHAILDGRDTKPNAGRGFVARVMDVCARAGVGRIATLIGRFYAMDRDTRWKRTKKAYDLYVSGVGEISFDLPKGGSDPPLALIDAAYARGVDDEEFPPTVVGQPALIKDGDGLIFFNFRSDRMRQLVGAFVKLDSKFERGSTPQNLSIATMAEYEAGLPVEVAFSVDHVTCPLACAIANAGLRQLHVAETEKYAHVTFFLNGGREEPFPLEERIMIPSPKVDRYDTTPAMATGGITDAVLTNLEKFDVIIANIAAPDMVAHTANFEATVKAIEATDMAVGRIADAVRGKNGILMVTADHGNAEAIMSAGTGERAKEHSANPVPCIIMGVAAKTSHAHLTDLVNQKPSGLLSDIAPTLFSLIGIQKPPEMTGISLV